MRALTKLEKDFNAEAKKYNIKAFDANNFDKDEELQKAFESYVEKHTYPKAKSIPLAIEFDMYDDDFKTYDYETYFKKKENSDIEIPYYLDSNSNAAIADAIQYMQELFQITHTPTAKRILCKEYFDIFTNSYESNIIELEEINKKIEQWHIFRKNAPKIKSFINLRYPRWGKATENEKKEYIEELENLQSHLEVLGTDTILLKNAIQYVKKYSLNKMNSALAKSLYNLNLPKITLEIAKEVVQYSKVIFS